MRARLPGRYERRKTGCRSLGKSLHSVCAPVTSRPRLMSGAPLSGSRLGRSGTQMNRSSSTTISAELGLRLVVPQQTIVPLVASLYYSGRDPYAVRMAFHVGTDEPVEWIFARDLLSAGIESRQGEGDVQVWPSARSCAEADGLDVIGAADTEGTVLNIELSSPFGQAHFEAPAQAMSAFLDRTYQIVPAAGKATPLTSRPSSTTCSARPDPHPAARACGPGISPRPSQSTGGRPAARRPRRGARRGWRSP